MALGEVVCSFGYVLLSLSWMFIVALDMSCFCYAGCLLYIWDRRGRERMVILMSLVVSLSVTGVMSMVFSGFLHQ